MKRADLTPWILPIAALAALLVVGFIQPRFLSAGNISNVIGQTAPLAIFAMAQMIPILTRGLDLSQGGIVVSSSVLFAISSQSFGLLGGATVALLFGLIVGLLNGTIIGGFNVSPFVTTLGAGSILQGAALLLASGQPISDVPEGFSSLFYGRIFGMPLPVLVTTVVALVVWLLLERMTFGRYIYAVGSNSRAAFLSGVPTGTTLVVAYSVSGLLTSLGSVLVSARIASGHPTAGSDIALQAVAAAVIGGVSLYGGKGTVFGALIGAVFLGLLANALNLLSVSSFVQLIAIGIAIILAVVIDRIRLPSEGVLE